MFRLSSLTLATLCTLVGFAQAEIREIQTAQGVAELPVAPGSVAVLDVTAADTLDALGVQPTGALNNLYVGYLEDLAANAADLGTFFEPDLERVHALRPDLIILGARTADMLEPFSRIAPTIDMTVGEDVITDALARLQAYGALFDRQGEAAALEAAFLEKLERAKQAAAGKGKALIVMTNGPKISAYGAAGRFGWLHTALGLEEAAPEISQSTHGEAISFEFIKEADPDYLIVIDRVAAVGSEGDAAMQTLDNVLVRDTTAWREHQIVQLSPAEIYIAWGGIQSMNRTLDEIISGFEAR